MKRPDDNVPIINGEGYFALLEEYNHHLSTSIYHKQVIYCYVQGTSNVLTKSPERSTLCRF